MNEERRKKLAALIVQLETVKAGVDDLIAEEQDALDGLPENMQQAEKGQAMDECIQSMDSASSDIDSAKDSLESASV